MAALAMGVFLSQAEVHILGAAVVMAAMGGLILLDMALLDLDLVVVELVDIQVMEDVEEATILLVIKVEQLAQVGLVLEVVALHPPYPVMVLEVVV